MKDIVFLAISFRKSTVILVALVIALRDNKNSVVLVLPVSISSIFISASQDTSIIYKHYINKLKIMLKNKIGELKKMMKRILQAVVG